MKLNKAMTEALYELFGPNGQRTATITTNTVRFRAFKELERCGLVKINKVPTSDYECLREVVRTMDNHGT